MKITTVLTILILFSSFANAEVNDLNLIPPEQMCKLPEIIKNNELRGMSVEECIEEAKSHLKSRQSPSNKEFEECVKNSAGDIKKMEECGNKFIEKPEVKKFNEEQGKKSWDKTSEDDRIKAVQKCLEMGIDKDKCQEPWKIKLPTKMPSKPKIVDFVKPDDKNKIVKERKKVEEIKKQAEEKNDIEKESKDNENLFVLLNVALKLEGLKVELVKITNKISALEEFYKQENDSLTEKRFKTVNGHFNALIGKINGIRAGIKSKDAELSKEDIDKIKKEIKSIKVDLKNIIKILVS